MKNVVVERAGIMSPQLKIVQCRIGVKDYMQNINLNGKGMISHMGDWGRVYRYITLRSCDMQSYCFPGQALICVLTPQGPD